VSRQLQEPTSLLVNQAARRAKVAPAYAIRNRETAMTSSRDRRHLALTDVDPAIALAQAARQDFERELIAHPHTLDQLIEPSTNERVVFILAPWRRFADLLRSNIPGRRRSDAVVRCDVSAP